MSTKISFRIERDLLKKKKKTLYNRSKSYFLGLFPRIRHIVLRVIISTFAQFSWRCVVRIQCYLTKQFLHWGLQKQLGLYILRLKVLLASRCLQQTPAWLSNLFHYFKLIIREQTCTVRRHCSLVNSVHTRNQRWINAMRACKGKVEKISIVNYYKIVILFQIGHFAVGRN